MDQSIVIKSFLKLFFILVSILIIVFFFIKRLKADKEDYYSPLPTLTPGEEKRINSRINLIWPLKIETEQGVIQAYTKDISFSGAFVLCETPLPLGEKFLVTVEVPNYENIGQLYAEVVWSNINVPDDKIVNRGMGIRFVQNSHEILNSLKTAITYHL